MPAAFSQFMTHLRMQLFDNEPHLPNYIAFYMSRSELGISDGGVLTICMYPLSTCCGDRTIENAPPSQPKSSLI